jgi:hypothetical protein
MYVLSIMHMQWAFGRSLESRGKHSAGFMEPGRNGSNFRVFVFLGQGVWLQTPRHATSNVALWTSRAWQQGHRRIDIVVVPQVFQGRHEKMPWQLEEAILGYSLQSHHRSVDNKGGRGRTRMQVFQITCTFAGGEAKTGSLGVCMGRADWSYHGRTLGHPVNHGKSGRRGGGCKGKR